MSYPTPPAAGDQVTAAIFNDFTLNPAYTYGSTIAALKALYLDSSTSKVNKASAATQAQVDAFVGLSITAGILNDTNRILGPGKVVTGLSGLTAGAPVYLSDTAGEVSPTPGSIGCIVGIALSTTSMLVLQPCKVADNAALYGDGSDGAVDMDGTNTYASFASKASSTYTLTRDVYATTFRVRSGSTLVGGSFRVYATKSILNEGTTHNDGGAGGAGGNGALGVDGAAGAAGAAVAAGSMPASIAGGAGAVGSNGASNANGNAGAVGSNSTRAVGATTAAAGGAGGASSGQSAGAGGAAGTNSGTALNVPRNVVTATMLFDTNGTAIVQFTTSPGSGGGGSGGRTSTGGNLTPGGGGGGGASGGFVFLASPIIVNTGTIRSNGGAGGAAGTAYNQLGGGNNVGGSGGGGAGDGGVVIMIYGDLVNSGTIQAVAGTVGALSAANGAGASTGVNGAAGVAGKVFQIAITA